MTDIKITPSSSESNSSLWKKCNIAMALIAIVMLLEVGFVSRLDLLKAGDAWSDINVILSGANFAKYGFFELRFLPVHQYGELSKNPNYYLHYPPLPNIINGIFQKANIQSLYTMRLISGLFSITGFLLLYRVLGKLLSPLIAVCGIGWMTVTVYFFKYCNSLHCHSYQIFFVGLFLFLFFKLLEKKSVFLTSLCWIVLCLNSLVSFEFILFCNAFIVLYLLFSKTLKENLYLAAILISASFFGVFLHLAQNVWAIGLSEAFADNMGFQSRNGDNFFAQFDAMKKMPFRLNTYFVNHFQINWIGICIIFILTFAKAFAVDSYYSKKAAPFLSSIFISSFLWYLFMPSHVIVHQHVSNQCLILFIIGIGFLIVHVGTLIKNPKIALHARVVFSLFFCIFFFYNVSYLGATFTKSQPLQKSLTRIIGPDACPDDAAIIKDTKLLGPYHIFFLQRPTFSVPQDMRLDRKLLEGFQKRISKKYHFYYLYYGRRDFTKDPEFINLASHYSGKARFYEKPGSGQEALVLFDIQSLLTTNAGIDKDIAEQQIKGVFPVWNIEGFDERLQIELY